MLNLNTGEKSLKEEKTKTNYKKYLNFNTVEETYNLYKQNKTLDEIANIRDLKIETVYKYMCKLLESGLANFSDIVSTDKRKKILKVIKKGNFSKLKELKEQLPDDIRYGEIRLALSFLKKHPLGENEDKLPKL